MCAQREAVSNHWRELKVLFDFHGSAGYREIRRGPVLSIRTREKYRLAVERSGLVSRFEL